MNSFKSKIEKIVEKYDCKDFDGYNIFRVLKLTNNEVKTQSRIIADLLNPTSKFHNQGKDFMKLFLKIVLNDENYLSDYKVHVEYDLRKKEALILDSNVFGRIDIFFEENNASKAILIENKVYAKDQKNQLERYYKFCYKKYGDSKNFKIIYINRFGNEYKTKDEDLKKQIVTIGYNTQIKKWLDECVKISIDENQKLILQQLINTNDYLTNIGRRAIRNRLIQFEIYKNKNEAEEIKEYLNDKISKHKKLFDDCEKNKKNLLENYNKSNKLNLKLSTLEYAQLCDILEIKKKLTFFDIVK